MKYRFVYITCSNQEEAAKIGKHIVQERLAACANIIPTMQSIYWWEGKVEEDQETVLVAKTSKKKFPELMEAVRELHSYDVPCIISLPIKKGNPAYLNWINSSLQHPEKES